MLKIFENKKENRRQIISKILGHLKVHEFSKLHLDACEYPPLQVFHFIVLDDLFLMCYIMLSLKFW